MIKRFGGLDVMSHGSYQHVWRWILHTAIAFALCCSTVLGGTFTLGQGYRAEFPQVVAVADLNRDGKLDLIVGGHSIMVYLGNGDGTFALKEQHNVEGYYIQVGDLNGDGIPDFAISNGPGVQIFLGNGDGSFRAGQSLVFPNVAVASPALGDFNHDGKLDLAVASYQTNQVQVFLGNGDGTFRSPVFYATEVQPQYTLAVDLNHDGNLDLVVTSSGDPQVEPAGISILLGNSDGTFRPRSFIKQPDYTVNLMYRPDYLAASDFDGDGNVDLLVQAINDPTTFVLYGSGTGSFPVTTAVVTGVFANTCTVGDFDGDGKPDIVCAGNGFTIVTNKGNRTFSSTTCFFGGFSWAAAGDFNRDGKLDLALAGAAPNSLPGTYIYLNSRAITVSQVSADQSHPHYGQSSHLTARVDTRVDNSISGFNTGCFSACPAGTVTWFDGDLVLTTTPLTPGVEHSQFGSLRPSM
jgi:hypothetical protein